MKLCEARPSTASGDAIFGDVLITVARTTLLTLTHTKKHPLVPKEGSDVEASFRPLWHYDDVSDKERDHSFAAATPCLVSVDSPPTMLSSRHTHQPCTSSTGVFSTKTILLGNLVGR